MAAKRSAEPRPRERLRFGPYANTPISEVPTAYLKNLSKKKWILTMPQLRTFVFTEIADREEAAEVQAVEEAV